MTERGVTESVVEQAALAWLESIGWVGHNGAEIAPGELAAERADYGQVVLEQRLRDALGRLNPGLAAEAREDAFRKLTRPEGPELVARNRLLHRLLVDGVTVEYRAADGEIRGAQVRAPDFDKVDANDWLAVNQSIPPDLPDTPLEPMESTTINATTGQITTSSIVPRNMCMCHSGLEYKECHATDGANEGKIVAPVAT